MKAKQYSSGQTLIEAVIALGITVFILVALVSASVSSLKSVRFSRDNTLASKYAQEGLEASRSIRDQGWALLTNGQHGLSWDGNAWSFAGSSETIGKFTRTVTIADDVPGQTKLVTVVTSWQESDQIKNVTLYTILAKLN